MLAAVYHGRRDVRVQHMPDPAGPGPDEAILRVLYCGICGTDMEEYLYGPSIIPTTPFPITGAQIPVIMGHEFTGEVVAVGASVRKVKAGDRVSSEVAFYCGECWWCRHHEYGICEKGGAYGLQGDGGLAEFVKVPARFCFPLAEGVEPEVGALAEPLAVSVRAMRRSRLKMGENVTVLGAGPIGLLISQVAQVSGARRVVVVEPREARRALADRMGADFVLNPDDPHFLEAYRDLTGGIGGDVVFECTGSARVVPTALDISRRGGRVVVVGIHHQPANIDLFRLVMDEREILSTVAHNYDDDFGAGVELLNRERLKPAPLITKRIPLTEVVTEGFEVLADPANQEIKIVVQPDKP